MYIYIYTYIYNIYNVSTSSLVKNSNDMTVYSVGSRIVVGFTKGFARVTPALGRAG